MKNLALIVREMKLFIRIIRCFFILANCMNITFAQEFVYAFECIDKLDLALSFLSIYIDSIGENKS